MLYSLPYSFHDRHSARYVQGVGKTVESTRLQSVLSQGFSSIQRGRSPHKRQGEHSGRGSSGNYIFTEYLSGLQRPLVTQINLTAPRKEKKKKRWKPNVIKAMVSFID